MCLIRNLRFSLSRITVGKKIRVIREIRVQNKIFAIRVQKDLSNEIRVLYILKQSLQHNTMNAFRHVINVKVDQETNLLVCDFKIRQIGRAHV